MTLTNGYITLSQTCDNHVTCILNSYTVLSMAAIFDDQLVPDKATSQAGVALPANWESQCQCVQTYELMSSAEDWKLCDGMLQKSMQVTITNVTRIQNLWL